MQHLCKLKYMHGKWWHPFCSNLLNSTCSQMERDENEAWGWNRVNEWTTKGTNVPQTHYREWWTQPSTLAVQLKNKIQYGKGILFLVIIIPGETNFLRMKKKSLFVLVSWGFHNKLPQVGCVKQQRFTLSKFWRPEVSNQGLAGLHSLWRSWKWTSALPASGDCQRSLTWGHITHISASLVILPPPPRSQISFCLSLVRTLVI